MNYSKLTKEELVEECKVLAAEREQLAARLKKSNRGSTTRKMLNEQFKKIQAKSKAAYDALKKFDPIPKTNNKISFAVAAIFSMIVVALCAVSYNSLSVAEIAYKLDVVKYTNSEGGSMEVVKPSDTTMNLDGERYWSKWAIDHGYKYVVYGGTLYEGSVIRFSNGDILTIKQLGMFVDPSTTLLLLDNPSSLDVPGYKYVSKGSFNATIEPVKMLGFIPTKKERKVFESFNLRGYVDADLLYVDLREAN